MNSLTPQNSSSPTTIDKLINWLQKLFNTLSILTLGSLVFVVFYQVFARYFLKKSPVWTEELSRYLFIYLIVLTSATVIIQRRHITLETIREKLKPRGQLIFDTVIDILIGCFCCLLFKPAWLFIANGARQKSPAMGVTMNWIYLSTMFFLGLVTLSVLLLTIKNLSIIFAKEKQ